VSIKDHEGWTIIATLKYKGESYGLRAEGEEGQTDIATGLRTLANAFEHTIKVVDAGGKEEFVRQQGEKDARRSSLVPSEYEQ
jgi:hypothetical protein